ncbi:unnamed protein product, partial [Mesorhabditis spiculigera]
DADLWSQEELQVLSRTNSTRKDRFRVYPERWFILLCACLLALSNASQWISYLSITATTDAFFCGRVQSEADSCKIGYYSNQIFQFVGMATGVVGLYVTDKYGIKLSLICGASFNALGAVIRFFASLPQMEMGARVAVLHTGSVFAAASQPFFLVLPPKIAEYWFPENQRALANVLSFIANPLGVAVGSMLPTLLIDESHPTPESYEMLKLNGIFLALGTIVFMLSVCIRRGCPPTPPSPSSAHHNAFSLRQGLANIFKTPSYVILLVPFGLAFAINWSVFIVTDAILDSLDYGHMAGYTTALAAVAGGVSSIVAGMIVDRTKAFKEVIRICYAGIVVTSIALDVLLHHKSGNSPWMKALMILLFISLGAFCIPIFPIGIELGVEMTFPVPEATSSGVLVIFGNALMFAVSFGMDLLAENVKGYFMHYPFTNNYWLALDFWCVLSVIGLLIVVFALNPKYKRLEFEQTANADSCAESHTDRKGSGSQATEVTNFSQNANDTSTKKERKTSENQATIYRL